METNVFRQNRISTLTSTTHYNLIKHPPSIVSVLRKPSNHDITEETAKSVYKDNWFDLIAINHLSKTVQAATGSYIPFCCNSIVITPSIVFILCRTQKQ